MVMLMTVFKRAVRYQPAVDLVPDLCAPVSRKSAQVVAHKPPGRSSKLRGSCRCSSKVVCVDATETPSGERSDVVLCTGVRSGSTGSVRKIVAKCQSGPSSRRNCEVSSTPVLLDNGVSSRCCAFIADIFRVSPLRKSKASNHDSCRLRLKMRRVSDVSPTCTSALMT